LAKSGKKRTCRAGMARCNEHILRKSQASNNVARAAPRGRTFGTRRRVNPQGSTGIKDPGITLKLRLKIERISNGFDRKAFGLEFVKRATVM
jgi:hypothetical protein